MLSVTVMSEPETIELVAVKVKDEPAFSAIDVAPTVNVTVGVASLSFIVIVTDCDPLSVASAPETLLMATIAVSATSEILSSVGSNVVVPVVLPAVIVISEIVP